MTQHFTPDEEARLRAQFPLSDASRAAQEKELLALLDRAGRAESEKEIQVIRQDTLDFLGRLGPDDNTYDVLVDPRIEAGGMGALIFCDQWLAGREDYAKTLLPNLRGQFGIERSST